MHATTEICSVHHSHHTTLLGQLWDRVTHRLAVKQNEISTQEELIRTEKEFQIQRLARRNSDIQRMIMRLV